MTVTYHTNPNLTAAEVADLFQRSGIRRPIDDLDRIGRMVAGANLIVTATAEVEGKPVLIGIVRALTDFAYCCYLSDMAVDRAYQRQGIGKELVRHVEEAIGPESMLLLLSAPEAMDYYPHVGFQKVENGWILPRRR
jgi:GNAT superfamily N-acetyltransferase